MLFNQAQWEEVEKKFLKMNLFKIPFGHSGRKKNVRLTLSRKSWQVIQV